MLAVNIRREHANSLKLTEAFADSMSQVTEQALTEIVEAQPNHYATHLAAVNQTNAVVANQDIYNKNGVLVAKQGTKITQSASEQIARHKLAQPLERQVNLAQMLDANGLFQDFSQWLAQYSDLQQIFACQHSASTYQPSFINFDFPAPVLQKLTVIKSEVNEKYLKSLFCAWLSWLIAGELELSEQQQLAAMLAGLTCELGFLHISPEILQVKRELTAEEWRAVQCHVVVGYLFLKEIPNVDNQVARAVLEHHERCDGTGYPIGKTAAEVSQIGKIVAMADTIYAIRFSRFNARGRSMGDLFPFLQVNEQTFSSPVYRSVIMILRQAKLGISTGVSQQNQNFVQHIASLSQRLAKMAKIKTSYMAMLDILSKIELQGQGKRKLDIVIMLINNLLMKMISSGVTGDDYIAWLSRIDQCADAEQELAEIELLQDEIFWTAKNTLKMAREFFDHSKNDLISHSIQLEQLADAVMNNMAA